MADPLLNRALENFKVEKFTGRFEDFEEFHLQWKLHLKIMRSFSGDLPDWVVLHYLKDYLDPASAILLEAQLRANWELSYEKFWQELRCRFESDLIYMHRRNWRAVELRKVGIMPTLQEWALFHASYTNQRQLVYDWSESEDRELVFRQLPEQLQKRVIEQTYERREGLHWVRVEVPLGFAPHEVKEELEHALDRPLPNCVLDKRHFVAKCASELEKLQLLEYDGAKLDDKPLRVRLAEYHMPGDDIFDFVRHELELEDELRCLRQTYGCLEEANESPASEESKPKGARGMAPERGKKNTRNRWMNRAPRKGRWCDQGTYWEPEVPHRGEWGNYASEYQSWPSQYGAEAAPEENTYQAEGQNSQHGRPRNERGRGRPGKKRYWRQA